MIKITPREALERAINRAILCACNPKPGAVILGLNPATREALKGLTSADTQVWIPRPRKPREGR